MKVIRTVAVFEDIIDFCHYWNRHRLKFESRRVYVVGNPSVPTTPQKWSVNISGCRNSRCVCDCYRKTDAVKIALFIRESWK